MGTNYFLHTNICPHCKRSENQVHIGKSSMGWPFLFRGYPEKDCWPDGIPHPITGALEWEELMRVAIEKGGAIIDEYGTHHTFDEFWQMVRRKQEDTRGEAEWLRGRHSANSTSDWRDVHGYRFSGSDFS
jgi:hypothetical protein